MVQVFSSQPAQSNASMLGQALGLVGADMGQQIQQQKQQSGLSQALFGDKAGQMASLPVDIQMKLAQMQQLEQASQLKQQEAQMKQQQEQQKEQMKLREKVEPLLGAKQTVARMRDISANGRLGRGSAIKGFFGGETARDRSEYEQLGKSLISFATTIPIRNRIEFETLAHQLYDPSLPDKAREGIMDAMERIINNSLSGLQRGEEEQMQTQTPQNRPPLDSFMRKK